MKKNYSKPIALMEMFTPNHFVASCEPTIDYQYTVAPGAVVSGIHARYDKGQDGKYTSIDAAGTLLTSDGSIGPGSTVYYVGKGWGIEDASGQITWPEEQSIPAAGLSVDEMNALGIHVLYLFAKKKGEPTTHADHVFGGTAKEIVIINMS